MVNYILRNWQRMQYLYRGIGLKGTTLRATQKIISPIYRHEVGYIIVEYVEERDFHTPQSRTEDHAQTEYLVLETPESLREVMSEIPSTTMIDRLRKHLSAGPGRIAILLYQPTATGSRKQFIGLRTLARGQFIAPRLTAKVSDNILFVCDNEILPQYRGQRLAEKLRNATREYCRRNRLNKICGVIMSHNLPSIAVVRRNKYAMIAGTYELRSLFGGLFKSSTSLENIRSIIEDADSPQ